MDAYDADTMRVAFVVASGGGWSTLAFSPDGTRLASTGPEAQVWDVASGDQPCRVEGPASDLRDVAFSPDGRTVIGCAGGAVRSWDAVTGALMGEVTVGRTTPGASPGETHSPECRLAVRADDILLATFGDGHDLRLWRVPPPWRRGPG